MAFTPFPPRQPSSSARLPLTLMTPDDWALATISGPDSEKYLQGQITADVSHLTDAQHLLAAHCDAKGKMWSNLRVFRREGGFAWIERRSLRDAQLTELKKYAVFSKVTIAANDDLVLLGVAGFRARAPRWRRCSPPCPTLPPRWSAKAPPACCGLNTRASASCW